MALKRIVILGAGGQARETRWLIEEINRNRPSYEFVGFVVGDLASLADTDSQDSVLGDESWLDVHRDGFDCLALGLANPLGRLKVARKLTQRIYVVLKEQRPYVIRPDSSIAPLTAEETVGPRDRLDGAQNDQP